MIFDSGQKPQRASVYLDVTELVYFRKRPTGIPRVVIETVRALSRFHAGFPCSFFYFDLGTRRLQKISNSEVLQLLEDNDSPDEPVLSQSVAENSRFRLVYSIFKSKVNNHPFVFRALRGFRNWFRRLLLRKSSTGSTFEEMQFEFESYVVSLGSSWNFIEFPDLVREYREKRKIRLVLFIHDMIPVLMPQFFEPAFAAAFKDWFEKVSPLCSGFIVNSQSTSRDLRGVLEQRNQDVPAIEVVRLGDQLPAVPSDALPSLRGKRFVLFVSTVETRKNHYCLYLAWKEVLSKLADEILVIVGKEGRNSQYALDFLLRDPTVAPRVVYLNKASDGEIAWMLKNCLFTVYPSHYEGWGLPVAESLCAGKYCIASNSSSIPEIGAELIDYHSPLDWRKLSLLIYRAISDPDFLHQKERAILRDYRPRSWNDTASMVMTFVQSRIGI